MSPLRPVPLALALVLVAGFAHAQVYQWKDAKGVTHYADAPPAQGQYQSRNVSSRQPVPAAAAAAAAAPTPSATAAPAPGKPADATAAAARAQANCQTATANLSRLKGGGDIGFDADGDGKPDKVMGAEERAKQTQVAQRDVASWCGSGNATP